MEEDKGDIDEELTSAQDDFKNDSVALGTNFFDNYTIPIRFFKIPRVETFTEFIQQAINILLNTYEHNAFEDVFHILDQEIRKYHYRGCKFYELTENYEFRNFLAVKLDSIKGKSVSVLKADINELANKIRHKIYTNKVKELLDYINSLYKKEDRVKFRKVLSELKVYGDSNSKKHKKVLVDIIRDGIRAIVFDHYTNLNTDIKRELKMKIATFLKKTSSVSLKSTTRVSDIDTVNISENKATEDKSPAPTKIDGTKTTIDTMEENKRASVFLIKSSDENNPQARKKIDTSKKDESNRPDASADEIIEGNYKKQFQGRQQAFNAPLDATLYTEKMSHKNFIDTEKLETIYKFEMRSDLVQKMLEEELTVRTPSARPITKPGLRHKTTPNEDAKAKPAIRTTTTTIEQFDRDRREGKKSLPEFDLIAMKHKLKNSIKQLKHLRNKVKELQKMYNSNLNNSNGDKVFEAKDKIRKNKNEGQKHNNVKKSKFASERQSNKYKTRPQTEENSYIVWLHNTIDELKKIDENNQYSRMKVTSNNDDKVKKRNIKDKRYKDKEKERRNNKKAKLVSERQSYNDKVTTQTEKNENKVRDTKEAVKKINMVNEHGKNLENHNEFVNNDDKHVHKLENKKSTTRIESTIATKSLINPNIWKAVKIPLLKSFESLPIAKNDAAKTAFNDNHKILTKNTQTSIKQIGNIPSNVVLKKTKNN